MRTDHKFNPFGMQLPGTDSQLLRGAPRLQKTFAYCSLCLLLRHRDSGGTRLTAHENPWDLDTQNCECWTSWPSVWNEPMSSLLGDPLNQPAIPTSNRQMQRHLNFIQFNKEQQNYVVCFYNPHSILTRKPSKDTCSL